MPDFTRAAGSGRLSGLVYTGPAFDGVTDVSAPVQAAINQAVSTGLELVLPAGTAIIGTPLTASGALTLRGQRRDATQLKAKNALNAYVLTFTTTAGTGTVGARISDLTVDGNCGNQTAGGGIDAATAVQCSFERLHFINSYNWGLRLGPINGGAFGHHNRVVSCLFDATLTSAGNGGGVWCTSSDENWFSMSDFEYLGGSTAPVGSNPVALLDQAGLQKINNVNFVGGRNNAIHVRCQNTKLTQVGLCTFDGSAGDSVFLTGAQHQIVGNVFTSPGDQGSVAASGVNLEFGATLCVVHANVLETSQTVGKTRSLLREQNLGGTGSNIITHNTLKANAAATVALTELAGTASTTTPNLTG